MSFLGGYNSTGGIQLSFLGLYNSTGTSDLFQNKMFVTDTYSYVWHPAKLYLGIYFAPEMGRINLC